MTSNRFYWETWENLDAVINYLNIRDFELALNRTGPLGSRSSIIGVKFLNNNGAWSSKTYRYYSGHYCCNGELALVKVAADYKIVKVVESNRPAEEYDGLMKLKTLIGKIYKK